jgi:hypothetical protein
MPDSIRNPKVSTGYPPAQTGNIYRLLGHQNTWSTGIFFLVNIRKKDFMNQKIINIAVIAHVDAGKSTLVDAFLSYSGALAKNQLNIEQVMGLQRFGARARNYDLLEKLFHPIRGY